MRNLLAYPELLLAKQVFLGAIVGLIVLLVIPLALHWGSPVFQRFLPMAAVIALVLAGSLRQASLNRDVLWTQPLPRWRIALSFVLVDAMFLIVVIGIPAMVVATVVPGMMNPSEAALTRGRRSSCMRLRKF
ncbi:MAG TPA: hypothetical protein VME66_15805 [Candidatus Acidoferrales bacterium]|nr:hypothetical protein [Candidatus Acidoferrales bacterium]